MQRFMLVVRTIHVERTDTARASRASSCQWNISPTKGVSQVAVFLHFLEHVQPAHQLTFHIQLGEGRPVAEYFQPLSHRFVLQDVERLEINASPA